MQFLAVPMTMRMLTISIVGLCLLGGAAVVPLLISFEPFLLRFGSARLIIVCLGVLIGLPCYFLFKFFIGRKTTTCAVSFTKDRLTIEMETEATTIAYAELERLVWCSESDYARVEVRGGGESLSLLVAMARRPKTVLPQLPALPQETMQRLKAAGLLARPSRRPHMAIFEVASLERGQSSSISGRS